MYTPYLRPTYALYTSYIQYSAHYIRLIYSTPYIRPKCALYTPYIQYSYALYSTVYSTPYIQYALYTPYTPYILYAFYTPYIRLIYAQPNPAHFSTFFCLRDRSSLGYVLGCFKPPNTLTRSRNDNKKKNSTVLVLIHYCTVQY